MYFHAIPNCSGSPLWSFYFSHISFNYNVQSNGFISERRTLKFWFVSINCIRCVVCVHFWCAKVDAPVYQRGAKKSMMYSRAIIVFLSIYLLLSLSFLRPPRFFLIWNFSFHCVAMDSIHNFVLKHNAHRANRIWTRGYIYMIPIWANWPPLPPPPQQLVCGTSHTVSCLNSHL